jgi:hypothetical protein
MPLREREEVEEMSRAAGVDFLCLLHDFQKRPRDSFGSSLPSPTTCAKNRTHSHVTNLLKPTTKGADLGCERD